MDCVKLISLVQKRKSLWDPQDSQYHNRVANRRLWCEVATSLNSTSSLVKVKWQRLRDTHRREIRRKSNLPTVSQTHGDSTWRYYSQMSFLEDTYKIKAMVGCSHNRECFSDNTHRDSESDDIDVELDDTRALDETDKDLYDRDYHMELLDKESQLTKRNSVKDPYDEIVKIEKAKLEHLQQLRNDKRDREDDDYYFLMSLLPYMRAIPKRRKLQLRMRLLQIMIEETENVDYNLGSSSLQ